MSSYSFAPNPSSQSSDSGTTPSSDPAPAALRAPHPDRSDASVASLAQTVDRVAQDHGLSNQSRQQLYSFAVQSNPTIDCIWIYAFTLKNAAALEKVQSQILSLADQLLTMADLIRHEWRMTTAQEAALKNLQRHYLMTAKTGYRNLAERTKKYLAQYPLQFSMPGYSDNAVAAVVNNFIEKDAHQARGAFRKVIFAAAVGGRPLEELTKGLCSIYSAQVGNGAPVYIQAHLAQLRLIAADIISADQPSSNTASGSRKRPRNDTGFWTTVDDVFKKLVGRHGADYNNDGWREWESSIMAEDQARFATEANQFSPEAIEMFSTA